VCSGGRVHEYIHESDRSEVHDLVDRARSRDRQAFARLFALLYDRIYRVVLGRLGSPQDAEEVADDVFVAVWRKLPGYEWTGAPFVSWVLRIAHLEASDRLRRLQRHPRDMAAVEDSDLGVADPSIERHADLDELTTAMQQLPDRYRQVLALRFWGGLTAEEAGNVLDMTAGNVRQLQLRALRQLHELVAGKEEAA